MIAISLSVLIGAGVYGFASSGASAPGTVQLHIGTDGRYFQYGSTTQTLTTVHSSCVINSAQPVMQLTSTGSKSAPGLEPDAIGVKGTPGSGNGTPCGQIDGTESLTMTPGSALAGRMFSGLRLDLVMTGNAIVKLTLAGGTSSQVYQLQTGTSVTAAEKAEPGYDTTAPYLISSGPSDTVDACAAAQSSGPNSGFNDNCEWTVTPGFNFDHITLTTVSIGTVSLEGSYDFGNDPNYNSVFYLAPATPVANNDTGEVNEHSSVTLNVIANDTDADGATLTPTNIGNISPAGSTAVVNTDGTVTFTPPDTYTGPASFTYQATDGSLLSNTATVSITVFPAICSNDTVTATDGDTSGSFTRLSDDSPCKRYSLSASNADSIVLFQPSGDSIVVYRGFVDLGPDPTVAAPGTEQDPLLYDPAGGTNYRPVPWCGNPQFDSNHLVTDATIPTGDTWCIASVATQPDASGHLSPVWQVFGRDDPKFTR